MAERTLRGSRLGAVSYETDRNHDLAPRQVARYRTDNGEEFAVPFADDAEFGRLHAAIRLALPIAPGIAASSPSDLLIRSPTVWMPARFRQL